MTRYLEGTDKTVAGSGGNTLSDEVAVNDIRWLKPVCDMDSSGLIGS